MDNKKKIKYFIKIYSDKYPDWARRDFKKKIFSGYTLNNDIINQIYCFLDLIDEKDTDYYKFFEYMKNKNMFDNKSNILEIGSGAIPILANIVNKYTNKKIITMEPNNIINIKNDVKNINQKFSDQTNIDNYDFIYAFRPCVPTEDIILNCLKNNKDFCIYLCNCALRPKTLKEYNENTWSSKDWHKYLLEITSKYKEKFIIKLDYETGLFDDCPIIYGIKR